MLLKELVAEGTWSSPQSLKQAQELAKLVSNPLPAKLVSILGGAERSRNFGSKLYDLMGDDDLANKIDNAFNQDPNQDIRYLIFDKLKEWLPQAKEDLKIRQTPSVSIDRRVSLASGFHRRYPRLQWRDPWDPEAIKLLRRLTRIRI